MLSKSKKYAMATACTGMVMPEAWRESNQLFWRMELLTISVSTIIAYRSQYVCSQLGQGRALPLDQPET